MAGVFALQAAAAFQLCSNRGLWSLLASRMPSEQPTTMPQDFVTEILQVMSA